MPQKTIALVEGDPLFRVPLARRLDAAGFKVVAAANGPEALTVLEQESVGLAVVDIDLPGRMSGLDVIREAPTPQTRTACHHHRCKPPRGRRVTAGSLSAKPFTMADLLAQANHIVGIDLIVGNSLADSC